MSESIVIQHVRPSWPCIVDKLSDGFAEDMITRYCFKVRRSVLARCNENAIKKPLGSYLAPLNACYLC